MAERPKRRRKRKPVNKVAVHEGRIAGQSYAEIAANLRISPSGAFYAENPRKRKRSVTRTDGLVRSVWVSDTDWEGVRALSREQRVTMAEVVRGLIRQAVAVRVEQSMVEEDGDV